MGKANEDEPKELDAGNIDERMPESESGEFYNASDEFESYKDESIKKPN